MVTAGDGISPYENGGAGESFRKRPFLPDQGGNSPTTEKSELEQTSKQLAYTRLKIRHPTTMQDLPDEILLNIFIRLLAKQAGQMRSVSKLWNALISHPSFVKSHLHHSIRNNKQQILLVFPEFFDPFTQYSCQSPHLEPINFIKPAPVIVHKKLVIGSVNGLICLSKDFSSDFHIWNPSISAMSAIPPPHGLSIPSTIPPPYQCISIYMRFGFDPKTDDYKIVRIVDVLDYFSVKEWLKVEVYSMRKGCWEFISQPIPSHITNISNMKYLFLDGHHGYLHWLAQTRLSTSSTILAFELDSETFREIPLPDTIRDSNHKRHHLGVLDGKLCEISWRKAGGWEVWVMEEYGVPESWAKRHVFP